MLPTSRPVLYLAIGLGAGGRVRCNSWMRASGLDIEFSFVEWAIPMRTQCRSQNAECRMKRQVFHSAFCISEWTLTLTEMRGATIAAVLASLQVIERTGEGVEESANGKTVISRGVPDEPSGVGGLLAKYVRASWLLPGGDSGAGAMLCAVLSAVRTSLDRLCGSSAGLEPARSRSLHLRTCQSLGRSAVRSAHDLASVMPIVPAAQLRVTIA